MDIALYHPNVTIVRVCLTLKTVHNGKYLAQMKTLKNTRKKFWSFFLEKHTQNSDSYHNGTTIWGFKCQIKSLEVTPTT